MHAQEHSTSLGSTRPLLLVTSILLLATAGGAFALNSWASASSPQRIEVGIDGDVEHDLDTLDADARPPEGTSVSAVHLHLDVTPRPDRHYFLWVESEDWKVWGPQLADGSDPDPAVSLGSYEGTVEFCEEVSTGCDPPPPGAVDVGNAYLVDPDLEDGFLLLLYSETERLRGPCDLRVVVGSEAEGSLQVAEQHVSWCD